jgi:hypothetical protein
MRKKAPKLFILSGFSEDTHRTHAYSLKGQRAYCLYNWGKKQRTNAIGASINGQLITACLFDCSINADIFYAWLIQDLLPKLQGDEVIVVDNASIHKRQDIRY